MCVLFNARQNVRTAYLNSCRIRHHFWTAGLSFLFFFANKFLLYRPSFTKQ